MRALLPFLFLAASGCAAMQQNWVDQLCNTEGSYAQGYNDGHSGARADSSYANMCPESPDSLRRAYRDGFDKGTAKKGSEPLPTGASVAHDEGVPSPAWECRQSVGRKICGYDCREL